MQTAGYTSNSAPGPSPASGVTEFERECVEFFAEVVQVLGVQRSVGQMYGLLFASPTPLSFTDIVEKLQISKGSASQGLQLLRSLGAVRGVAMRQDRRELFEPELGLRNLVGGVLRDRIDPLISRGNARMLSLRESAKRLPDSSFQKFSLRRVKQLETWRRQMWLLSPVLKTIIGTRRT